MLDRTEYIQRAQRENERLAFEAQCEQIRQREFSNLMSFAAQWTAMSYGNLFASMMFMAFRKGS